MIQISLGLLAVAMNVAFINCSPLSQSFSDSAMNEGSCPLAPAHLRSPTTIDQATDLINALPKPLSIPCLIENLPRPLKVFAVNSTFSAQPSSGLDNPRIFIINGNLVLSVTPAGIGRDHIEYGQFINTSESVKAELSFPITSIIPKTQPYDEVKSGGVTSCRTCHGSERSINGFGGDAFVSRVVRPDPFNRQSVNRMRNVALSCNSIADPVRCEILNSIFVVGRAQEAELP